MRTTISTLEQLLFRLRMPVPPIPQKNGRPKSQLRQVYAGQRGGYWLTYASRDDAGEVSELAIREALKLSAIVEVFPGKHIECWEIAQPVEVA